VLQNGAAEATKCRPTQIAEPQGKRDVHRKLGRASVELNVEQPRKGRGGAYVRMGRVDNIHGLGL